MVEPAARLGVVQVLEDEHHLSRRQACRIAGVSRSALYKPRAEEASVKDAPIIEALNGVVSRHGRWGFWKCFHWLRSQGHGWNHKRVHRVYCNMKLNLPRRARKRVLTRDPQPLQTVQALNKVWSLDFMRDTLYDGRPFRTLNIIDEGNREGLRIECGSSISSLRLVRVMQELVEVYGKPEAIRLDNGPEMTSHTFVDWARDQGIRLMFIQPGKPNQNAFIERFNRSFRTEVLDACLFDSVDQVQAQADAWLTDYNEQRPHESLGNVPPAVYMPRTFPAGVSTFGLSS